MSASLTGRLHFGQGPKVRGRIGRSWAILSVLEVKLCDTERPLGVDTPVAEPAMKRELHKATGACAVDMESHVMGRLAAAHGLAFAAARVIIDPAERAIPSAALLGMRPDGGANAWAVLRDVVARPSQLMSLVRLAVDSFAARAELLRVRRLLGPHFRLADIA